MSIILSLAKLRGRSPEKATEAKGCLERLTNKYIFEIVLMDVSSLSSVRKAIKVLKDEAIIDGIVLNAGGGGGSNPTGLTADGVTNNMAVNMLGHVLLVDELLSKNKISGKAEEFCQVVTQVRNIEDVNLNVSGDIANDWMSIAQCFAGGAETPPQPGTRKKVIKQS